MDSKSKIRRDREVNGFDVVCTIGRVNFGAGDVSAYEAAFALIGANGGEGSFRFPHENGGTVEVNVGHSSESATDLLH